MRLFLGHIFLLGFSIIVKGQRYSNRDEDLSTPLDDYSYELFTSQTVPNYHKTFKPNSNININKLERYQQPSKPKHEVNKITKNYYDKSQGSHKTVKPIYEASKINYYSQLQHLPTTLNPINTEDNENYEYPEELHDSRNTFKPTNQANKDYQDSENTGTTQTLQIDKDNTRKMYTTSATITSKIHTSTKQQEANIITENINSKESNVTDNNMTITSVPLIDSSLTTIDTLIPNSNISNINAISTPLTLNVTGDNVSLSYELSNVTLSNITSVTSSNTTGNNSQVNSSWPLVNINSSDASLDTRGIIPQNDNIMQLINNKFYELSGQLMQQLLLQNTNGMNNIQNSPSGTTQLVGNLNQIRPIQSVDNIMQDVRNPSKSDLSQLPSLSNRNGKIAINNASEFKDYIKSVLAFMQVLSTSKQYACYQYIYCLLQDVFEYIANENEVYNPEISSSFIALASLFDGASNYPISETYEKNCAKRFQDKCTDIKS